MEDDCKDVVNKVLTDFASFIDVDVTQLNADESELLLRKLMACQTRTIGMHVCAAVDMDDVARVHAETQGSAWQYGQEHTIEPAFYRYIFSNLSLPPAHSMRNDTLSYFEQCVQRVDSALSRGQCVRLFHSCNLENMRDNIIDTVDGDVFRANAIHNAIVDDYQKKYDGEHVVGDVCKLWDKQARFTCFSNNDIVLDIAETPIAEQNDDDENDMSRIPLKTLVNDDTHTWSQSDELELQRNPLVRSYSMKMRIPVTFDTRNIARQMVLVAANSDPMDMPFCHRNQNIDDCWNARDTLLHTDNRQDLKHVVDNVLQDIPSADIANVIDGNDHMLQWFTVLPRHQKQEWTPRQCLSQYLCSTACNDGIQTQLLTLLNN